jgi:hypothetical protein
MRPQLRGLGIWDLLNETDENHDNNILTLALQICN